MTEIEVYLKPDNNDEIIRKVPGNLILCLHLNNNIAFVTSGLNSELQMDDYQVGDH